MNVIGLDLSLTAPGIAPVGARPYTLRTDAKTGDRRFCIIRDHLNHWMKGTRYDLAMIEAVPPYESASGVLERVHGVAREILARHGVPFAYVNVSALKVFATGDGRADKAEVMAFVAQQTGRTPDDDNQADAWVLQRMGEMFERERFIAKIDPRAQRALASIEWPLKLDDPAWPQPYGAVSRRKPVTKKCGHKVVCLKNGDHWLHPFNVVRCDKPPK